MLVSIGRKRPPTDVLDTILGCHARIRAHLGIAARVAESSEPDPAAVVEAAGRVLRYFSEALPLHSRDEDEGLVPRLFGRSAALDRALESMKRQHRELEEPVATLVSICATLQSDPTRLLELRAPLADVVQKLSVAFDEHLTLEERVVFPAARASLTHSEKEELAEDVRRRHRGSESLAADD